MDRSINLTRASSNSHFIENLIQGNAVLDRVFLANRYSDDSSAVYRFTSLGRLKEDFAWFNWGIITMGQDADVELRIVKCSFGSLVIEANKLRDACLWRS